MLVVVIVLVVVANNASSPEYKVIDELDRGDSYNVTVTTNQTEESDIENIVKDVKEEYEGVDALWLWVNNEDEELVATAKIPYNSKGKTMIGEEDTLIEMEK
ncbi:hypothetical protein [Virgibacillus salexigens]|uniref:hypothetical protein n=1 Tax=Virgibacillus salexigens TaxID=61016 RepID=UPI00308212CA